jgi:hypothetical protein
MKTEEVYNIPSYLSYSPGPYLVLKPHHGTAFWELEFETNEALGYYAFLLCPILKVFNCSGSYYYYYHHYYCYY